MDTLSKKDIKTLLADGTWVIDSRPSSVFVQGFIPQSVHIPPSDHFTEYAELLLEPEIKAILITAEGDATTGRNLAKLGYVSLIGTIEGGYEAWLADGGRKDILIDITAEEFELDYAYDEFYLIDLRSEEQYEQEHFEHAENLPLADVEQYLSDLSSDDTYYLYGDSFEDAAFAGALFKRAGFHKLRIVNQAFDMLKETKIPIEKKKKTKSDSQFSDN